MSSEKKEEEKKVKKFRLYYPDGSKAGYIEFDGVTSRIYNENGELLFEIRGIFPPKPMSGPDYSWIEKVMEEGLDDARKRFILYVASRYLVNVRGLSEEEAVRELKEFYSRKAGGKVYESWLRSVVRGVKSKRLLPWSLNKIENRDKDLYNSIMKVLEKK